MPQAKVFYSWQSDLDSKTNRGLILDALERAAKRLRADDTLGIEPVIDRDVQGVPGAPDIHTAIFNKIRDCDAAVFDVSVVEHGGSRLFPNPNVMIELGYALGTIGWERVVLVFNEKHGEYEKLPFDIRSKHGIVYSMAPSEEPAQSRNKLVAMLEDKLKTILKEHPRAAESDSNAKVIEAIDSLSPGWPIKLKRLFDEFCDVLGTETSAGRPPGEVIARVRSFSERIGLLERVLESLVINGEWKTAQPLIHAFLQRLCKLSRRQGFVGQGKDHDVQRMVGWRVVLRIVRLVSKHGTAVMLSNLLNETFEHEEAGQTRLVHLVGLVGWPERLDEYAKLRSIEWPWVFSELVEPHDELPSEERAELARADFLLGLFAATAVLRNSQARSETWYLMIGAPDVSASRTSFADELRSAANFDRIANLLSVSPEMLTRNWTQITETLFDRYSKSLAFTFVWSRWPEQKALRSRP